MAHTHDHDHDHGHSHSHGQPGAAKPGTRPNIQDEAANRSLSDALRLSFAVLRVAMVVLLAFFIFSGIYSVDQNEVVVQTRFGQIVGEPGQQVRQSGQLYFGLPEPLEERIRVPTTPQQLTLERDFWFSRSPGDPEGIPMKGSLDPQVDGSLLTGDQNIVHAKWELRYQVDPDRAVDFVRNVGIAPGAQPMAKAEALVRMLARQAIVETVANVESDAFVRGTSQREEIQRLINGRLRELETGMQVSSFEVNEPTFPGVVRPAFLAVTQAESERQQQIEEALRQREQLYSEAAGRAYPALLLALTMYEDATAAGDTEKAQVIESSIAAMFDGQPASEALAPLAELTHDEGMRQRLAASADASVVGGESRRIINEAQAFRTSIVQETRADVERFQQLLDSYRQSPDLVRSRLLTEAMTTIFADPTIETIQLPETDRMMILEAGRDPQVLRNIEQERNRQAREQGAPQQ